MTVEKKFEPGELDWAKVAWDDALSKWVPGPHLGLVIENMSHSSFGPDGAVKVLVGYSGHKVNYYPEELETLDRPERGYHGVISSSDA